MSYYTVYRESIALQSCIAHANSKKEAKINAEKEGHWQTDDIYPCTDPNMWDVEKEED